MRFANNILFATLLLSLTGCNNIQKTSEQKDSEAVQRQQDVYQKAQPIPFLDWSLERDIVIQLYKARNERVATYTVWRGDTSVIEGHCSSIGYPIPYDTSLTNPLQMQHRYYNPYDGVDYHLQEDVVEQPEPNGIFASKNSIATWVRCVVDGKEAPIYVEGKVTAYPYPIRIEDNIVVPVAGATPSVVIEQHQE